jgi:hypothetical protein
MELASLLDTSTPCDWLDANTATAMAPPQHIEAMAITILFFILYDLTSFFFSVLLSFLHPPHLLDEAESRLYHVASPLSFCVRRALHG